MDTLDLAFTVEADKFRQFFTELMTTYALHWTN